MRLISLPELHSFARDLLTRADGRRLSVHSHPGSTASPHSERLPKGAQPLEQAEAQAEVAAGQVHYRELRPLPAQ